MLSNEHKLLIKKWRLKNKDKVKAQRKKYYQKNKEEIYKKHRQYVESNCERLLTVAHEAKRKIKTEIMQKYGSKCANPNCCTNELDILTIDHVNDDGADERRKKFNINFYNELRKEPRRFDLQILCFSCQWRKRFYGPDFSTWKNKAVYLDSI